MTIHWGDGTTTVNPKKGGAGTHTVTFSHTYAAFGVFTPTLTVTDDDDASDSESAPSTGPAVVMASGSVVSDPLFGTVLDIRGTDLADVIRVNQRVQDGQLVFDVLANSRATPMTFGPVSSINRIRINACNGDDQIIVSDGISTGSILYGGAGNDNMKAGRGRAADILIGGDGNDTLVGGAGRDLLIGGAGADRIVGDAGGDILIAGYTSYDDFSAAH